MPTSGTNLGQTFNQQYGTGTSEIFDTSSMVNVARDLYNSENQWNKMYAAERRKKTEAVDKKIATLPDWWQRDKDVLMPEYNDLLEKAAKYRSRMDDPFTGYSNDPEIQAFQKQWRDFEGKAAQSVLERGEFEKYQARLFDKNSNALDEESKKRLDEYYAKPISERWGKVAPQMRVKDPSESAYNLASDAISKSKIQEWQPEQLDDLANTYAQDNEGSIKLAKSGKVIFDNLSPELQKAALQKYGKDIDGNINYTKIGQSAFRNSLDLVANQGKPIDFQKELFEVSKVVGDKTDIQRNSDGSKVAVKNSGAVESEVKSNIKNQLQLTLTTNKKFQKAFWDYYENIIDPQGKLGEKELNEKVYQKAIDDIYRMKDMSKTVFEPNKTTIVNNNGEKESKGGTNEWLNDLFSGDVNVQKQAVKSLIGSNKSLGAAIDNATIKSKKDANGNEVWGVEITYTSNDPDPDPNKRGMRMQRTEFIEGTAENNSRLLDLIEGATSAQKKNYKRIIAPSSFNVETGTFRNSPTPSNKTETKIVGTKDNPY